MSPCVGLQCVVVLFPDQFHEIQYVTSKAREMLAVPERHPVSIASWLFENDIGVEIQGQIYLKSIFLMALKANSSFMF